MSYDISRALKVLKSIGPDGTLSFNVLVEAFQDARAEEREACAAECLVVRDDLVEKDQPVRAHGATDCASRLRATADAYERGRAEALAEAKRPPKKRRPSPTKGPAR